MRVRFAATVGLLTVIAALAGGAQAEPPNAFVGQPLVGAGATVAGATRGAPYRVALNKSTVVPLYQPAQRISIGNPGVADILVLSSSELYIVGKALGSTNVVVWGGDGRLTSSFDIEVTHDLETLKQRLHELLPGEDVRVYSAEERLILGGQVSSVSRMDAALQLAGGFLPDCVAPESTAAKEGSAAPARAQSDLCDKARIVNMMQVGGAQQVMLKITVAEMAHNVIRNLSANLNIFNLGNRFSGGAVAGGAAFPNALDPQGLVTPVLAGPTSPIGPAVDLFDPSTPAIDTTGLFMSYLKGDFFLEAVLDISKRNGLAKILSEPTLTTLTGQEAQFISGGEFPIPVPQGGTSNATTIQFKEFGVGVKFIPLVLDSGHINLTLNVTVSDLSSDNSVTLGAAGTTSTFVIPSLTKRSASSTVELADGQTIGIAGLINDNVREFVSKFPGLGDLPLLGALFRSQQFVSGQTELVIFVTPYLARPIAPHEVRLPTDGFVPPGDLEFYLLGSMGDQKPSGKTSSAAPRQPPATARFGHDL